MVINTIHAEKLEIVVRYDFADSSTLLVPIVRKLLSYNAYVYTEEDSDALLSWLVDTIQIAQDEIAAIESDYQPSSSQLDLTLYDWQRTANGVSSACDVQSTNETFQKPQKYAMFWDETLFMKDTRSKLAGIRAGGGYIAISLKPVPISCCSLLG